MLTKLLKKYSGIIKNYDILKYDREGPYLRVKICIHFNDDSVIHIRQTVTGKNRFKYSYHFQDKNDELICRWDNAPHWHEINTYPHHVHIIDNDKNIIVRGSKEGGDIELVFEYISKLFNK